MASIQEISEQIRQAGLGADVKTDLLPGGNADGKPDSSFDPEELALGIKEEMGDHTKSEEIASEIAKDHLIKDPHYYSKNKELSLRGVDVKEYRFALGQV